MLGWNQAPFLNKEWEKLFIPEAGCGIIFGKTQLWRTNLSTKIKEVKVFLLARNTLKHYLIRLLNEPIYKNQRSKSVSPRKKYVKTLFNKATNSVIATNKVFWKFIKPFLTNKSCHEQNNIMHIKRWRNCLWGKRFTWSIK